MPGWWFRFIPRLLSHFRSKTVLQINCGKAPDPRTWTGSPSQHSPRIGWREDQWETVTFMLFIYIIYIYTYTGWWLTYPSAKYESQLGWWHSQYMEKNVPNISKPPTSNVLIYWCIYVWPKKTSSIWIQLFLFKLPPKRKHLVLAAFPAASLWVPGRGLKTVAIILAGKHILKQQFLPSMHKSFSTRESKKLLENAASQQKSNWVTFWFRKMFMPLI